MGRSGQCSVSGLQPESQLENSVPPETGDRRFGSRSSGKGREVAVGLVDVGLVPGVVRLAAVLDVLLGHDHDKDAVFPGEVNRTGQPDCPLLVDFRFEGLDHGES